MLKGYLTFTLAMVSSTLILLIPATFWLIPFMTIDPIVQQAKFLNDLNVEIVLNIAGIFGIVDIVLIFRLFFLLNKTEQSNEVRAVKDNIIHFPVR